VTVRFNFSAFIGSLVVSALLFALIGGFASPRIDHDAATVQPMVNVSHAATAFERPRGQHGADASLSKDHLSTWALPSRFSPPTFISGSIPLSQRHLLFFSLLAAPACARDPPLNYI
jgi:hypothetical protein